MSQIGEVQLLSKYRSFKEKIGVKIFFMLMTRLVTKVWL